MKKAALKKMAHKVAELLEGGVPRLVEEFRAAPDKHADETPWPCDRKNGYAWGFFTPERLRVQAPRHEGVHGPGGDLRGRRPCGRSPSGPLQRLQLLVEGTHAVLSRAHFKRNARDLLEAEPENAECRGTCRASSNCWPRP